MCPCVICSKFGYMYLVLDIVMDFGPFPACSDMHDHFDFEDAASTKCLQQHPLGSNPRNAPVGVKNPSNLQYFWQPSSWHSLGVSKLHFTILAPVSFLFG